MKKIFVLILLILSVAIYAKTDIIRPVTTDWLFVTDKENAGEKQGFVKNAYDTSAWQKMPACEYWETVIGDYDGTAWYKRCDSFSQNELKQYKYVFMDFESVADYCYVYVNGKKVFEHTPESTGFWPGNLRIYPFVFDIKPYLVPGENQIKLKVENTENKGGIYKPVKYILTDKDLLHPVYKSVAELNPEFSDRINQARKPRNQWSGEYTNSRLPLSILYMSDIHADSFELERLIEFYNQYIDRFDDFVCGGDMVALAKSTGFEYWSKVKGAEKILFVMGNHEGLISHHPKMDWNEILNGKESFDYYFKNNIKNWNVVYEEGKPYYYKDYTKRKIRLIGLDCMLRTNEASEQQEWLKNALAGAKEKDYTVLIVTHFPPKNGEFEKIKSRFTSIDDPFFTDVTRYGTYDIYKEYAKTVDDFMKKGGKFVGWLCGHEHRDCIGYFTAYPKQLVFVIDCASREKSLYLYDTCRTNGEKSMDLAEAIVIDTKSNTLKIVRVGADRDLYLRNKDCMTINYVTKEIIE